MLELPESNIIAGQLNQAIAGKIISQVFVNQSPHRFAFYTGYFRDYPEKLEGKQIDGSVSRGGLIEIQAEEMRIVLSDGAFPRYYEEVRKAGKKNQLLLWFDDDTGITVSVQMYGCIMAFEAEKADNEYYKCAVKKPSPLSDEFTFEYFMSLREGCSNKLSLKAFLATEQRIPGLGNGVLQDILYNAGLHPKKLLGTMEAEDYQTLHHSVRSVLKQMIEHGGRDVERDLYGNPGGYMTYLSKKTLWQPCPKCGNEIHKAAYMGGTIYYCDQCQRM